MRKFFRRNAHPVIKKANEILDMYESVYEHFLAADDTIDYSFYAGAATVLEAVLHNHFSVCSECIELMRKKAENNVKSKSV